MDKNILQRVEQLNKQRKATKRWQRVVAGLAAVVLIATNGALSLPAETTENQTFCGIEAHEHTDECHEISAELICGKEESDGHTHIVGCYSVMLCGQDESAGHSHDPECYGEKTLSCGKEESAGHAHDETCNGEATLTCGQDGVEGHNHEDSCYTTPIVCGQEVSESHSHTDECYTTALICQQEVSAGHAHTLECCDATSLNCGMEESEEHHHDDDCYGEEVSTLTCEKEVHTHELICFSDPSADVETAASWESAFNNLTLSENWSQDLVTVAKTQLGYTESSKNYEVEDDGITTRGYTRYGAWAGDAYMDWSAAFVAFCLNYAKVEGVPAYAGGTASQWRQAMQAAGMTRIGDTQAGDLVFMDDDADGTTDHVGIVTSAEGSLTIILGDDQNSVRYRTNPSMVAVIALPENPNAPTEATTVPAEETTAPTDPADETTAPTDPADETTAPTDPEDETTAPTDPEDETTAPTDPEDETTAPTDPEDETTAPTDPEDETTAPTDPADETTAPTDPADETTAPTNPADETTDPTEDYSIGLMSDLITGNYGDYITYTFNPDNGELIISGTGAGTMPTTYSPTAPWITYDDSIKTVIINSGVTSIGNFAFFECVNLNSVQIADSVTSIGMRAFANCTSLTSITLPASVTSIENSAISDCPSLTSITLPAGASVDIDTLKTNCPNLTSLKVYGECGAEGSDVTFALDIISGELVISGEGEMEGYYRSTTSSSAPWGSFAADIETVVINDGVTNIGSNAFSGCTNLTNVSIPDDVATIGAGAFFNCSNMTGITIPDSVASIAAETFTGCTSLTSIEIPNNVTSIGYSAFQNCTSLTSIEIPSNCTSIGSFAFQNCKSLTSIEIPSSVTSIESTAFSGCDNLTSITLPAGASVDIDALKTNCPNLTSVKISGNCGAEGANVTYELDLISGNLVISGEGKMADFGYSGGTYSSAPWGKYYEIISSVVINDGVESIGNNAFYNCANMEEIEIADSVSSFGSQALSGCTGLTEIVLPESLTSIGSNAFYGCTANISGKLSGTCGIDGDNLTYEMDFDSRTLTISGSGDMYDYKYSGMYYTVTPWDGYKTYITNLVIEDNVTSIGNYAFYGCTNLKNVAISDDIATIGTYAFNSCTSLQEIDLPDSLTKINDYVFSGCTSLESVKIPASVETIGGYAFQNCSSLTEVGSLNNVKSTGPRAFYGCPLKMTISGSCGDQASYTLDLESGKLTISGSGDMDDYSTNSPWYGFAESIKEVVIESDIAHIGNYAFYNCTNLTSATIPESVKTIGDYAFYNCTSLSISIPETVTSVGNRAFDGCTITGGILAGKCGDNVSYILNTETKTLTLSGSGDMWDYQETYQVPWYSQRASIETVIINEGVESIGGYAFRDCSNLTSAEIPESVATIGASAFSGCTGLTSITLPESLTSIGTYAFSGCTGLTSINIPKNVTTIGAYAFNYCDRLETVVIPDSVTEIGTEAFKNCTNITNLTVPDGVLDSIRKQLSNCPNLKSIKLSGGTTGTVYRYALSSLPQVEHVELLDSVTTIGYSAFQDSNLKTIVIPDSVTSIGYSAFENCTGLESITIPDSVTSIGYSAFENCTGLESITIPNSVTTIGYSAFASCTGLETATLSNGLVTIPKKLFLSCANLKSVVLPNEVIAIESFAFGQCTSLANITLPESLTTLGDHSFYNCDSLTSIEIPKNVTSIGSYAFCDCDRLETVTIPEESNLDTIGSYAFSYCDNLKNVNIAYGVTTIDSAAFAGCDSLESITIPDSVTTFGAGNVVESIPGVFQYCDSLKNVTLSKNLTSIPQGTFRECPSLESITIPESVTSIEHYAFYKCSSLKEITLDAKACTSVIVNAFWNCDSLETLIIGTNVDTLSGAFVNLFTGSIIKFQGVNYFALDADVSNTSLSEPFATLAAGDYYVDEQGVIYALDSETMTATLFHCPAGVEDYTVPATIPTEDGTGVYTLTTVARNSFSQAVDLTSVTFPAEAAITVESYAFTGSSLESVNGESHMTKIEEALPEMNFELQAFAETGIIEDRGEEITDSIAVAGTGLNVSVTTEPNTDGSYNYYTGEEVTTTIEIENTIQDNILRVYISFDADDPNCSINQDKGDFTYEGRSYSVFEATNVDNTYCLEFLLVPGDTFSFSFTSTYANGTSDGGSARIYAVVLTSDEQAALGDKAPVPTEYNLLTWDTQPDPFAFANKTDGNVYSFIRENDRLYSSNAVFCRFELTSQAEEFFLNYGNDNVDHVEFTTTVTLPEGLIWRSGLADAIKAGNIKGTATSGWIADMSALIDDHWVQFLRIYDGNGSSRKTDPSTVSVEMITAEDGTEQMLIKWRYDNPSAPDDEILPLLPIVYFHRGNSIEADQAKIKHGETYTVVMDATADIHYTYTDEVPQLTAQGVRKISAGDFSFSSKVILPTVDRLHAGEAYPVTLQITNNSAAISYLQDLSPTYQLPDYYYMSSADLAEAFQAEHSDSLTVTIKGANLCTNGTASVIGTDGNPHTVSSSLMGQDVPYLDPDTIPAGHCASHRSVDIILSKTEDGNILIKTSDGNETTVAADASSIQSALDSWGFTVGYQTVYKLNWNFGHLEFAGKETINLSMPTHAKDTFMRIDLDHHWFAADSGSDYFNDIPFNGDTNGLLNIQASRSNEAGDYLDKQGNKTESADAQKFTVTNGKAAFATVWRDFVIFQGASKRVVDSNGEATYEQAKNVTAGDILKFDINVLHWGDATYEALPLVTRLTGPHYPLVPTAENTALANSGLTEETVDDVTYYMLNKEGTYQNVYIGGAWADEVIVSGDEVMIYWYLTGNYAYTRHVFLTAVNPSEDDLTNGYSVGIYEWLNNHQTHRLWDEGLLPGNIPHPEKEVVTDFGDLSDPEDDKVTELHHVTEGESVTYRLSLLCDADTDVIVQGKSLWDVLPLTVEGAAWSNQNITVRYAGPGQIRISEGSAEGNPTDSPWTEATEWVSGSEWEIADWEDDQVHQRLKWDDDFQIKFTGKTYIYVTLQFPEDIEGGSQLWTELVGIHGTTRLENIFHQYSFEDAAYLDLSFGTEVSIQKGVVESGVQLNAQYSFNTNYNRGDGLSYYANPGVTETYVTYYASIYNDGPGRLYIESIQDVLPKGFSIVGMADAVKLSNAVLAPAVSGTEKTVRSYGITNIVTYSTAENVNSNGETRITFKVDGDQTTMTGLGFVYDETLQRYYLMPGTHVYFGYNCKVGEYADTADPATNRLAVSFYDYSDGGITAADDVKIGRSDKWGTKPNDGPLENGTGPDCWVTTGQDLSGDGFDTSGEFNDVWLTTNVTVKRDKIVPGITKSVAVVTSLNNNKETDSTVASGSDVITWRITSVNSSWVPINGYTLTDVMAHPYTFADESKYAESLTGVGNVIYTVYASQTATSGTKYTLFTIKSRSTADDGTVTLTLDQPASTTDVTVTVGGDPVEVLVSSSKANNITSIIRVNVSFSKDDAGNEVMSIEFPTNHTDGNTIYRCPAIPANGRSELLVNTFNVTGEYKNTQYINQCYLTPVQDFDGSKVGPGRYVEEMDAVYNFAQITVSSGYATSAYKAVTDGTNTAVDNQAVNYIRINSEKTSFRYELTVVGTQSRSMDQLVIIDNLPQKEDFNIISPTVTRGSGFQVDLDDTPDFKVIVTTKDGTETELDSSAYAISFSGESGPFSDEDWAGTTDWKTSMENPRSIRIVITNDENATIMPAGSTVTVSFDAKVHIDSDTAISALYDQTAWNSFGYSYRIGDSVLQAAPLNVGVRFRSAPTLEKQLLDSKGDPYAATEAETFRFLIYAGEALNLTGETEAAIAAALDGITYTIAEITVPAGSSSAELLLGNQKQYSYSASDGWVATDTDWIWTSGNSYTFMELPISDDSRYIFTSIGGSSDNSYTLAYDGSTTQTISAINSRNTWALQINKLATNDNPLAGAWFGLYSPNASNALPEADVKDFGLDADPPLTYTIQDETTQEETTYYLMAISRSDADGIIRWSDLQEDQYLVRELQAPNGYFLSDDATVVTRKHEGTFPAQRTVTVYNDCGYVLPEYGGEGTYLYTLGGMLMITAALLWYNKTSRRKEDGESS